MKEKIVDEKKVACLKVFQLYEHLFFHPFHLDFSLNFQFESKRSLTTHTKNTQKEGDYDVSVYVKWSTILWRKDIFHMET